MFFLFDAARRARTHARTLQLNINGVGRQSSALDRASVIIYRDHPEYGGCGRPGAAA